MSYAWNSYAGTFPAWNTLPGQSKPVTVSQQTQGSGTQIALADLFGGRQNDSLSQSGNGSVISIGYLGNGNNQFSASGSGNYVSQIGGLDKDTFSIDGRDAQNSAFVVWDQGGGSQVNIQSNGALKPFGTGYLDSGNNFYYTYQAR